MLSKPSLNLLLRRLWRHISRQRRRQFRLLLGLTVVSSFAEIVSLGSVVPFIGMVTEPEKVFHSALLRPAARAIGISSPSELVLPVASAFAVASLVAAALRLALLSSSLRLANDCGADLSVEVYRRTLFQPYSVHVSRSSSEILSGITQKVGIATSVLISVVTVTTTVALFLAILATLLFVDPVVAITAFAGFGVAYGLIAWQTRRRLARNSILIAAEQTKSIKSLQEGLGAIRDVLLDGTQLAYTEQYRRSIVPLQKANAENAFMSQGPRYAIEGLGMVLIAALVLALSHRDGGVAAALPVLGVLALGAERLLPLLQQVYGNWSVIVGSRAALEDVLSLLDQPLPETALAPEPAPLTLADSIRLVAVSFRYADASPLVLDTIDLEIGKGERLGVMGTTGSGKSTLLDVIMGLLEPTSGKVFVDGRRVAGECCRAWQRAVAHVPQAIFLADATIAENIAFGVPLAHIDRLRVQRAASQADLAQFIEGRAGGYDAVVGERGVRLSGGQRQRIGIARALYKQAQVIVFDEATSALDNDTEESVMQAIGALSDDLTIIMIAHRLSTLRYCTRVIDLRHGRIVRAGSYAEIVSGPTTE